MHQPSLAGFSPEAMVGRIEAGNSRILITADEGLRAGKKVPLKSMPDVGVEQVPGTVAAMIVVRRTGGQVN